ncbi:MAG: tetratricopeptide repeat protein [Deltaproteobacteria bacterium]|nr:tetratricopeptide repeat protein [Deltaproteobacteria bacterium]
MEEHNVDNDNLISRLKELPLQQVPPDLTDRIMARVSKKPPGIFSRLSDYILRPITISLSPAYAFSLILIVCGAFLLGRISLEKPAEQLATAPAPTPSPSLKTDNAQAAYMIGRGLLEAEKPDQAIELLQKAALLEPDNPEYAYWEGVGYWLTGNQEQERQSYLRGLRAAPESVPLLTNLGHNYLNEQQYEQALKTYQAVLTLSADEPVPLYNIGLINRKLGKVEGEIAAWKAYLQVKRTGKWAFRAVERLNAYGDFSYRPYRIGVRKIIVSPNILLDGSLSQAEQANELAPIITMLENNQQLRLDIVVFIENDLEMARQIAIDLKRLMISSSEKNIKNRIKLSWFKEPESITLRDDVSVELAESLLIFSSHLPAHEKEVSI